jgi:hypothetical protein
MGASIAVLANGDIIDTETNQIISKDEINKKISTMTILEKEKINDIYEIYRRPNIYDAWKKQLGYK